MSVQRVASRYAKSLIDLAQEQNKLDRILEDIQSFKAAVANRDFYLLLKSPIINGPKKIQIFKELFAGKFDKLTVAFLDIVTRKSRETYLPEITEEFIAQYKALQHISTVKLTTATKLNEAAIAKIKEKLVASDVTDLNVEIETAVNPDLLGGFVLEFDDKLYDASVAHKIKQLKKEFAKNTFVKKA